MQNLTNDQFYFFSLDALSNIRAADINSYEKASIFADMCRLNTLTMIKEAGSGHVGSSFSAMDVVSWLYLNEITSERGIYFSSKGHDAPGLYAVLIGAELLEFKHLHMLRHIDGLPGHPHIGTGGAITNTGSLGMGISKAKGFWFNNQRNHIDEYIYVMLGDGELQEGQIWESLGSAANNKMGEIIAFVDHNKLQSDTYVEQVNDLGDLDAKFESFGWHCQRIDGHDLQAIDTAIRSAKANRDVPSVIICDTVKGQGVDFMNPDKIAFNDLYPFHSGAPVDDDYLNGISHIYQRLLTQFNSVGLPCPELEKIDRSHSAVQAAPHKMLPAYSEIIEVMMTEHDHIIALDADLRLDTGLVPIRDRFENRFFECGIAEQDMVSMAGSMATKGLLPIVHSFSCFLSSRPNEQIYNNATEASKIIYMGALAGILPGGPGHSHQAVRDINALGSMPGMTVVEACDPMQLKSLVRWAVEENSGSTYIRLTSIPFDIHHQMTDTPIVKGQGRVLRTGEDGTIVAYGPIMVGQAMLAAATLAKQDIDITVIDMPWLNSIDIKWLKNVLPTRKPLLVIDNHYEKGGLGEFIGASLMQEDKYCVSRFGVKGLVAVPECGRNDQVMAHHKLDVESLVADVLELLRV